MQHHIGSLEVRAGWGRDRHTVFVLHPEGKNNQTPNSELPLSSPSPVGHVLPSLFIAADILISLPGCFSTIYFLPRINLAVS